MSRNFTAHKVRIIGGRWRGRKIPVIGADSLRPSKDIVRETLFNWLQPLLPGSHCLDVFAGSGALGFEAASRDAAEVLMLESSVPVAERLCRAKAELQADQVTVWTGDAISYLQSKSRVFDIVFLDPPFDANLLYTSCQLLAAASWLHRNSRVFLEASRFSGLPELPRGWVWLKQKHSGDVCYGLALACAS